MNPLKNREPKVDAVVPALLVLPRPEPLDLPSRTVNDSPGPKDATRFDAVLWRKAKLSTEQAEFIDRVAAGESAAQVIAESKLKPSEQRDALLIAKCVIQGRKQAFPPEFEKPEQHELYRKLSAAEIALSVDPVFNSQSKTRERTAGFVPGEALFEYSDKLPEHIRSFEIRAEMVREFQPRLSTFIDRIEKLAKDDPKEAERLLRAQAPSLFNAEYFTERLKPVDGFVPSLLHVEALQLRGEQLARIEPERPKALAKLGTPPIRQIGPHDLTTMPYAMWCRPAVDIMSHSHRFTRLNTPASKEFACELSQLTIEKYADRMNDPRGIDGFRYSFFTTFEDQELWKHQGASDAYYNNRHRILATETERKDRASVGSLCEERDLQLCDKIYNARRDRLEAAGLEQRAHGLALKVAVLEHEPAARLQVARRVGRDPL